MFLCKSIYYGSTLVVLCIAAARGGASALWDDGMFYIEFGVAYPSILFCAVHIGELWLGHLPQQVGILRAPLDIGDKLENSLYCLQRVSLFLGLTKKADISSKLTSGFQCSWTSPCLSCSISNSINKFACDHERVWMSTNE